MQKTEDIKKKIEADEDFINSPNYRNSLKFFISKNPEGVSNDKIAKVLMISEQEVEESYQKALLKLKKQLTREGLDD
jgi:hypothetical protein